MIELYTSPGATILILLCFNKLKFQINFKYKHEHILHINLQLDSTRKKLTKSKK